MNIDEKLKEIIETAKTLNAKIELVIKGDCGDADYAYDISLYTAEDFEKKDIASIYKFFKTLADDTKNAYHEWFTNHNDTLLTEIETAQKRTLEDFEIDDRYKDIYVDGFEAFIPSYSECSAHMIEEVNLRIVVKEI